MGKANVAALRQQTEVLAPRGSSDAQHNPFHVGDAAAVLDLLLDVDEDGDNHFERDDHDDHAKLVLMSATLRALRAHAVAITRIEHPRRFRGASSAWLRSGIRTSREPSGIRWKRNRARVTGDIHYHCAVCDENLATLGMDDGVRTLSAEFTRRLRRHVNVCAMRYLLELHKPPQLPEVDDGV